MIPRPAILATAAALLAGLGMAMELRGETLRIVIRERTGEGVSDRTIPARIHLRGPDGKSVRHPRLPSWNDHFVCDGKATLDVPPGAYALTVERGPEYRRATAELTVVAGETLERTVVIERWIDLAARGWWSGELHVHRPLEQVPLHLRAEDLHVAPVLTIWNQRNLWAERSLPERLVSSVDGDRFYHALAVEDERRGGALLFFNLRRPLDLSGQGPEYPSPVANLERALEQGGVHVDIEKPFWWDAPTWAATGKIDTVGIANNHMCRSRMYESEAWGRPRDTDRLPPPRGNGFFTQELYYRLLDCGFRLAPSAGSASGVLPNPVGYNRVYVKLPGKLDHASWWRGLVAGRSFVTNGPILLVSAREAGAAEPSLAGSVFRGEGRVELTVSVEVDGNDPLERVEVIRDGGRVERIGPGDGDGDEGESDGGTTTRVTAEVPLVFERSGWFLVRAIADVDETFRFASSAPFWVEVDGQRSRIYRDDVVYFIEWIETRMARIRAATSDDLSGERREKRLEAVLAPHRRALDHFRALLRRVGR